MGKRFPPPLIEQLAEGGRMIIPVGPAHLAQELKLVKKKRGEIKEGSLFSVRFVPFKRNKKGTGEPKRVRQPLF